jgi:bacillolysin
MGQFRGRWVSGWLIAAVLAVGSEAAEVRLAAVSPRDTVAADARIEGLLKEGRLVRKGAVEADDLGRRHERFVQQHRGIPVWGSGITRQNGPGGVISSFGSFYEGIGNLDVKPTVSADGARVIAGGALHGGEPTLYVFPTEDGRFVLAWYLRTWTGDGLWALFIDARTGLVVHKYNALETQAASGLGTGVLGDHKKMSASHSGATFVARDIQRPAVLETYDFRHNVFLFAPYYNGTVPLTPGLLGTDTDNDWSDGSVVDAHTYAGWTYDYYFKQQGRHGINGADMTIVSLVNPVALSDIGRVPDDFFTNAFWDGSEMVYGIGYPRPLGPWSQIRPLCASLEIVAHELTHGVTDYTSNLIYEGESGALNEAFSDIMGVSVDFYQNPTTANYVMGEAAFVPHGVRSMQSPTLFGDPDHYSVRYTGTGDNGGVHINSGIVNHAFYLAIEGGTNRVSGIKVTGVGGANREQISKAFYRAFTLMLPPSARFSDARAATIQSATDLFGGGSPAASAITAAWNAVGVS